MMCEVMPTISEGDSVGATSQRGAQNGADGDAEANFEQLMVNMLDERDKLLDSLRETQETLIQSQTRLQDALHERDLLQRQLSSALPQVSGSDLSVGPYGTGTVQSVSVGPYRTGTVRSVSVSPYRSKRDWPQS